MYVYVVTHKNLKADMVGKYKNLYCYQIGFFTYRNLKERGYVFTTAEQAISFMVKKRY
jgi:hypothetical protein